MKRLTRLAMAGTILLAGCAENSETPTAPDLNLSRQGSSSSTVTTSADAGTGSFRAAIAAANSDPAIRSIKFKRGLGTIKVSTPLLFSGTQSLEINGADGSIDGSALGPRESILTATGGGDLDLSQLTLRKAPGSGLVVDVPDNATGTVEIRLDRVVSYANGLHGVLINDQSEYFTDPNSTAETGSAAGLKVIVTGSRFEDNGFAEIDQDGLRINEGGDGHLYASITGTQVLGNGGDGVELDERGAGNALFTVTLSRLEANGAFDPSDYDDGIDVDEAGDGDVVGAFWQVSASRNYEQGVDLNENGAGDMSIVMLGVTANDNRQEGIELEEDDDVAGGGDIQALMTSTTTLRNGMDDGDAGLKLREKGPGNLKGHIINAVASDNAVGGILLREDAEGDLAVDLTSIKADRNAADGIRYDENAAGNLVGAVLKASTIGNAEAGIHAEQATTGTGALKVRLLTASGNGDGSIEADADVVVDQR